MRHSRAKLSPDDVRLIRQLGAEGARHAEAARNLTTRAIAGKFGISQRAVSNILSFQSWRAVK